MRSDWSKMWRVICSNTARAKRTQIFTQKSIQSFCLETLETAKVSSKDEIYHWTPLETLYSLSVLLCSVLLLDLFSKWQVEGKGSKTSAIVYFSTVLQMILQTFLSGNRYRRESSSHILCVVLRQLIYLCLTMRVKKVEFLQVRISLWILHCYLYYF